MLLNREAMESLGVNAEVYKVDHVLYGTCIIKYFDKMDEFSSMQREVDAYKLIGVRCESVLPTLLEHNEREKYLIYRYIDGYKVSTPTRGDIQQVIGFIKQLKEISTRVEGYSLVAKHACFSYDDIWKLIYKRFCNLTTTNHTVLLGDLLDRLYQSIIFFQKKQLACSEHYFQSRILSPSDISFNNMIKDHSGKIYFIDFEFFGWDDPVKLVSDFLWHPQNQLSFELQAYFLKSCIAIFIEDASFVQRLKLSYPLYGLVWVMILLNNYLPVFWDKKLSQGLVNERDKPGILKRQLAKARVYLNKVKKAEGLICRLIDDPNIYAA